MTGFREAIAPYSAGKTAARLREAVTVGLRGKIGGIGQGYDVVELIDEVYALIHTHRTDERLAYRIDDIILDDDASDSATRFGPLIGQHRSIGPDGPTYLILKLLDREHALICVRLYQPRKLREKTWTRRNESLP